MSNINEIEQPANLGNPRMGWGSDVAAEMMRRTGLKYVALNPGASFRGLHDSIVNYLGNNGPQMLLCLHEDHAVSIAHGYAKVTGEPMGCILHSNVGLMHGLMGIFNAWCDRAPLIVFGATGPVDAAARRPWIDWIHTSKDQGALLRNYVKYDDEPRSATALVESMLRANMIARTEPTGPVYICFDAGLQEEAVGEIKIPDIKRYEVPAAPSASPDQVERAADMLIAAKAPVILVGRVSRQQSDWDNRIRLAELLGAKVLTDLKNAAAFPTEHALHAAPPQSFLNDKAKTVIREADIILGLDWVDIGGTFQQSAGHKDAITAPVINCTLDSYLHNGWSTDHFSLPPVDLQLLAEPDGFVAQLLPVVERKLGGKPRFAPTAPVAAPTTAREPGEVIRPRDIGVALQEVRADYNLTVCKVTIGWASESYQFRSPLDYLGSAGGGGLGSGPGAAIGAALALKDSGRIPVAVLGDGDFMQGGTALWTAAHYQIPLLFIISNNLSNFNDEVHQEAVAKMRGRPPENKWIGMRIDDPALDFVEFAHSQGVEAIGPVASHSDLQAAIRKGLDVVASGKPFLIDVRVQPGYSAPLLIRSSGETSTGG
jgi:thiamine pyrophosphate-dependent acetolactate synthase large subunit-like protein